VESGCYGCVHDPSSSDPTAPRPELALNPNDGPPTITHLSPDEIGFQRFGTDSPYPDNGIVKVLSQTYVEVDLWLPESEHATATAILNSFTTTPTTTTTTSAPQFPPPQPPGETAYCNDGTFSSSLHHSGTCSHHGGVAWFYTPPTGPPQR
jgi:Protein of unknown function (DUF3761)